MNGQTMTKDHSANLISTAFKAVGC